MKIDLQKKAENNYTLIIDGEKLLENVMLSVCLNKVERYAKIKFLKEEPKESIMSKLFG